MTQHTNTHTSSSSSNAGNRHELPTVAAPPARERATFPEQGEAPMGIHGSTAPDGHLVLSLYFRDIGAFGRLSVAEEIALAQRIKQGDLAARECMIKANLRLVVKIAKDFDGLGLPLLDLISEGNIGLMKAVERFDPAKGAKVSTYAAFYIKQAIRRALSNQSRTIRVPVHVHEKLQLVQSATYRLQKLLGRAPTSAEIAAEAGLPVARVQKLHEAMQATVSLDDAPPDREEQSLAETTSDEYSTAPDEALANADSVGQLQQFIGRLTSREQAILRFRFGLEGEEEGTLAAIGRRLGLTQERVRQIQNQALAKLRKELNAQEEQPLAA